MSTEKPKVFISHSWENKAKARQLEDELKAANIEVWVDHSDVRGGDVITQKINEAIDWCNIVLLVWTQSAAESLWVEREWSAAMQLDKTIITCLFDKTKIPNLLTGLARLDFRNFEEGLNNLFIALRSDRRIKNHPWYRAWRQAIEPRAYQVWLLEYLGWIQLLNTQHRR